MKSMKFNINRIRAIVFMVAAFGYLPLQSAEQSSLNKKVSSEAKVEQAEKVTVKPIAGLTIN